MRSGLSRIIEADGAAALEWRSTGTLGAGATLEYAGVTIPGLAGDEIARVTAYFDPAPVVPA